MRADPVRPDGSPPRGGRPAGRWAQVLRPLRSPYYLAVLGVIIVFAVAASGSPRSYFAFSLVLASIYIVLALAWDVSSGLTGYLNFGIPFFFGLGAFSAGFLSWNYHQPVIVLLPFAVVTGVIAGFLFSVPTVRLRGPYFALFSFLLPIIGSDFILAFWTKLNMPEEGYYGLPFLASTSEGELIILSIVNGVLLTAFLLLKASHFGLVLRGIRDDEDAVAAQGIRTFPYKVIVFTLASGVFAFAGAAYATVVTFAGIDAFGLVFILFPLLIVTLGGMGEIAGSVLTGYVVILLYQYMFPTFSELTLVLFTAVAIVLVMFLPGGLLKPLRAFVRFMRTPEAPS